MIENAPPGPIETNWGPGFRTYEECLGYIRETGIEAPEGGVALPLRYTVSELPTSPLFLPIFSGVIRRARPTPKPSARKMRT